jgi:hypothetical protein
VLYQEHKRELRENRRRARRCNRGRKPQQVTVRFDGWEGAASRIIRKSEDLPEEVVIPPRTEVLQKILRIKRDIPGSMEIGPGIFFARTLDEHFSRRMAMKKEFTLSKLTLLLIRNWDGFQTALWKTGINSRRVK